MRPHLVRSFLVLAGAGLIGCGLGDYEKRLDEQAKRLHILDEDNLYLGAPLTKPAEWPFVVCLRFPRDIEPTPLEKPLTGEDLKIFVYPGKKANEGFNVFAATATLGEKTKDGKFKEGEFSPEEFRRRFRQILADAAAKDKRAFDFHGPETKQENWPLTPQEGKPPGTLELAKQVVVEKVDESKAFQFTLIFHQKGQNQIGLAYQGPRSKTETSEQIKALELSLKSLDIGPDAAAKKALHEKFRPK